jgi:ATP-dependent DNA helicase RecG
MQLDSKIETLPRINKPHTAALKKLGIFTVRDLLFHFPYRYLDFSKLTTIREIKAGENISLKVTIKNISSRFSFKSHLSIAEAVVSDGTGSLKVVWFNQGYLAKTLQSGDEIFLAGAPDYYNFSLQLTNPIYEKVSDFPLHTARLVPIYHLTQDLYPKTLRNLIQSVLHIASAIPETLPEHIITNQKLLTITNTIHYSHFPESLEQVEEARKRLAFEEIFLNQLLAQKHKLEIEKKKSFTIPFDQKLVQGFLATLAFQLTPGQKKATWDILQDLEKATPMNRLMEADVGSGKTIVALIAALETTVAGYQVAFLAPTEILAKQHYETIKNHVFFKGRSKTHGGLLTNHYSELDGEHITKPKLQKLIAEGMPGIFVGTHALLGKQIKFKKLALVIIDEQHRFGVEQRAQLFETKGKVPHLLSLTATPIPRTLQLAYYGELAISQIKSKPANRKPIATKLVGNGDRPKAYAFIAEQIKLGRQVFVITPLIEESETLEVKAVKSEYTALQKIFPQFKIGLLHGKMKGAEKEKVMADFLANNIQLLVSTSVVEVGVDVPNASVMVIEGAERFGLAQLHQFRGRVGRAEHQSYCFLFTEKENSEILERLTAFTKTQDGFALAELDLKQRGFGQLYGAQQSGWNFKYFNPSYTSLIPLAREEALKILQEDLSLNNYPLLRKKIKNETVHFE